jgi:hypothetical protein
MNLHFVFEAVGIAASLLVSISLCMKNIKGLRIINLMGSAVFLVYGIFIISPSILILNGFSMLVNIYYLSEMYRDTKRADLFDVLFIDSPDDELLGRFVRFYGEDILRFFPSFNPNLKPHLAGAECCFILRETLPVSLVAYKREKDDAIRILVDYVIPAYRDMKNAQFFFTNVVNRIASPGTVFQAAGEVPAHVSYLKRIGFIETGREGKAVHFKKAI